MNFNFPSFIIKVKAMGVKKNVRYKEVDNLSIEKQALIFIK